MSVPLDWAKPDGQAITLRVGRVRATKQPRLGTLFVNPGGPGGSGVELADRFANRGLEQYDIVGWDPRGAGESTPVRCIDGAALDRYYDLDVSPDDAYEDDVWQQANRDFGLACLRSSGELLAHISTLDTVRDLDFLRAWVGDPQLNYLGYSYGTELGAVYAHLYPATSGRLVLDGAVDITGHPKVAQIAGFERALGAFASWCAPRSGCELGTSRQQVLATVKSLLDRLDQHQLPVGDRWLTQSLGTTGVIDPLYAGVRAFPALGEALVAAVDGDGRRLLEFADAYNGRDERGEYGPLQSSFTAIRCTEADKGVAGARSEAEEAARQAPVLGPLEGYDYVCPLWPVAAASPLPHLTAAGADPILVIGTTGDPATPYEYAQSMAAQLEPAHLLTYRGEGHTVYGNGVRCVDDAVVGFLVSGVMPSDGTTCG